MNLYFRGLLTLEACSWMLIVFVVNDRKPVWGIPGLWFALILGGVTFLLSWLSILWSGRLSQETDISECKKCELADADFLPVYLGFFFVSLSAEGWCSMLIVFGIVCCFMYFSQVFVFNPLFLFFNYHYYKIETSNGTIMFVMKKGSLIRNAADVAFDHLHRINDLTYIERS